MSSGQFHMHPRRLLCAFLARLKNVIFPLLLSFDPYHLLACRNVESPNVDHQLKGTRSSFPRSRKLLPWAATSWRMVRKARRMRFQFAAQRYEGSGCSRGNRWLISHKKYVVFVTEI